MIQPFVLTTVIDGELLHEKTIADQINKIFDMHDKNGCNTHVPVSILTAAHRDEAFYVWKALLKRESYYKFNMNVIF